MTASDRLPVLHVSAHREDHGGIQSTLQWHHARDAALGLDPRFLSLFDPRSTWPGSSATLAAGGWDRVGEVQRRFGLATERHAGATAIYHDGWGIEWFAPRDRAGRRIVYLHTERPHADDLLRQFGPRVDGFLSVSESYARRARRVLPDFPEERICVLPFFVDPPGWAGGAAGRGAAGRPVRLGYAGRIEQAAKRLDRLPALVRELDRKGVDFRFEVLGDGAYLEELRRELATDARVSFLGWRSGEEYWRTIADWDMLVLLSDYEGFSRSAMECMACGTVPIHPDFAAAAGELLGPAAAQALYPTGDVAAAAGRIATVAELAEPEMRRLRQACAARLAGHAPENYGRAYADFVRRIAALPRRSESPDAPGGWSLLPLGIFTRLFPRRF